MSVDSNIIKRLRVFIGGELGEGAANLIESQAAQIAHLQMALADTEALEAGTSERCLKQAAQIGNLHATARNEALEEAASICEFQGCDDVPCGLGGKELAETIRAMKETK